MCKVRDRIAFGRSPWLIAGAASGAPTNATAYGGSLWD